MLRPLELIFKSFIWFPFSTPNFCPSILYCSRIFLLAVSMLPLLCNLSKFYKLGFIAYFSTHSLNLLLAYTRLRSSNLALNILIHHCLNLPKKIPSILSPLIGVGALMYKYLIHVCSKSCKFLVLNQSLK